MRSVRILVFPAPKAVLGLGRIAAGSGSSGNWLFLTGWFPQAGSHIQTLMGSQSLQHRSREQQYEGSMNKVTIQQYQPPLPIQIPSSQSSRAPQPQRCLIQTKGQRSTDAYQEQVRHGAAAAPGHRHSRLFQGVRGRGQPRAGAGQLSWAAQGSGDWTGGALAGMEELWLGWRSSSELIFILYPIPQRCLEPL